ncbi:MAG: 2-oxo-4-hydroxy-4-carboxy-5-ureidoimidazoline decarboxylase [Proteobacteria bacterium]|nr:2-oxo-4-hydroxy-4-carboxy-5-ureidoimidazoline decarboxylase [Pseudomonadota bacterium]
MTTITLDQLNAMSAADFTAALADIYEHSPWVAEAAARQRPYPSLAALHEAMVAAVKAAPHDARMKLIAAHPDLAGKAARAGALTKDSTAEQTSAGLDRLSEADYARFHELNDAYKAKFGIPFIVCVRRHTKDSILAEFERRLSHGDAAETDTALGEIVRIGALRLDSQVSAAEKLPVAGRLSTHVLDTHSGRPAEGVGIELWELSRDGAERLIVRTATNKDGRTDGPLIGGRPVPRGTYELRFAIGGYFRARGVPLAAPPFLDIVPIRFGVAEPEGHYHVPISASPWAYGTYRGS